MAMIEIVTDDLTKRYRVDVKETGSVGWLAVASYDNWSPASYASIKHYEQGKDSRYIDTWKVSN